MFFCFLLLKHSLMYPLLRSVTGDKQDLWMIVEMSPDLTVVVLSPGTCWRPSWRRVKHKQSRGRRLDRTHCFDMQAQIVINRTNCQRLQGVRRRFLLCPAAKCQCLPHPPPAPLQCVICMCVHLFACGPCLHFTVIRTSHWKNPSANTHNLVPQGYSSCSTGSANNSVSERCLLFSELQMMDAASCKHSQGLSACKVQRPNRNYLLLFYPSWLRAVSLFLDAALSDSQANSLLNGNFVVAMFKREINFKGTIIEYSGSDTKVERINCTERIEEELILQVDWWSLVHMCTHTNLWIDI